MYPYLSPKNGDEITRGIFWVIFWLMAAGGALGYAVARVFQ